MRALTLLALCLVPAAAEAETINYHGMLDGAEAAFRKGVEYKDRFLQARPHFAKAADQYYKLHELGVRSPALYRNLGDAALLADRLPESIWAYHMSVALDPNNARAREHLAFARSKVLYPPSGQGRLDPDTWPAWLHRPTLRQLLWTWIAAYAVACVSVTISILRARAGRPLGAWVWLASIGAVLALTSGVALWQMNQRVEADHASPLVVVAENTPFYLGNATSYPPHASLPRLPRGMEVRQIHRRGDWLQVRLTTGEIGWLPAERVWIVEP
jgi:hypothetical protein